MNAPELNVHEDSSGRRVYETGGRRYSSVTTILSEAYPKPHLMGWGSKMAAQAAVEGGHEGMSGARGARLPATRSLPLYADAGKPGALRCATIWRKSRPPGGAATAGWRIPGGMEGRLPAGARGGAGGVRVVRREKGRGGEGTRLWKKRVCPPIGHPPATPNYTIFSLRSPDFPAR